MPYLVCFQKDNLYHDNVNGITDASVTVDLSNLKKNIIKHHFEKDQVRLLTQEDYKGNLPKSEQRINNDDTLNL